MSLTGDAEVSQKGLIKVVLHFVFHPMCAVRGQWQYMSITSSCTAFIKVLKLNLTLFLQQGYILSNCLICPVILIIIKK